MIVYAACVADQAKFDTICQPGIARAFRDGDFMVTTSSDHSIFEAYNEVLDAFRERDDLEALVLLHEDTEILSPRFPDLVRASLDVPDVAIVGAVGGLGQQGMAWWRGSIIGWVETNNPDATHGVLTGDVDGLDGFVLVMSPWSVRNLRFDDVVFDGFDGYDADICRQAVEAGKRVRATPLPIAHRDSRVGMERAVDDNKSFQRADAAFRVKWEPQAGVATRAAGEREDVQASWHRHLLPLVAPGAGRILDVGEDAAGRADVLRATHPGADVVQVPALTHAAGTGPYDVVVLADALERTHDPDGAMRAACDLLTDDGTVVFSVPNAGSFPFVVSAMERSINADRWAFPGSTDVPVRHFTLTEAVALVERTGVEITAVTLSGHDLSEGSESVLSTVDAARVAAGGSGPRGDATTHQRMMALRYYAAARATGRRPATPAAPRLGDVVDAALVDLLDPAAQHVARLDQALAPDGDVIADGALADAVARLADGPYDAVVLGTALDHVRHPGRALRTVRSAVRPGGAVLATVTNLMRYDLFGDLLERDAFAHGQGPLAHHPTSLYTLADLPDHAANGGLYVEQVEDEPLPIDPARVAVWTRLGEEMGYRPGIGERMAVARMRVVMRRPDRS